VDVDPTSATVNIERNKDAAGASAHGTGAVVTCYEPTPTLSSNVVSPKSVSVYIHMNDADTPSTVLVSESGTAEITGGVSPRERGHGDCWKIHGYVKSSDLACKTNFSTWAEQDTWDGWYRHIDADERALRIQFNTVAGYSMCLVLLRQVFELPALNPASDDHVPAVIESEDRGSRTGLPSAVVATF
jgi:hypothetical protein